ncbi:MAG: CoA transferase [Alphaproteobacteria bacterium]|nr:CoA transferase [Alphaproteobacteria bacterium]
MAGPLDGLTVIDATRGMPGAVAGLLLADHGARVIRVETPGDAPDLRAHARRSWERGKLSIALDLDDAADLRVLDGMLARADVLFEDYGAAAARYGLDRDTLERRLPALVSCAFTGYGDAPMAGRPAVDCLVAARLGLMAEGAEMGYGFREGPLFPGHPHIAYGTGFIAAMGVLAALRARRITGRGQQVAASMLDGVLAQSPMNWWWHEKGFSYIDRKAASSGDKFGYRRLITRTYQCADGTYLQIHTGGPGGFKRTMDILGLGEKIREIKGQPEMAVPLDEEEYQIARFQVEDVFRTRDRDDWIRMFHEADLAALPVLEPAQVLKDEQLAARDHRVTLPDPELGQVSMAAPAVIYAGSPAATPAPAPSRDQHGAMLRRWAAEDAPAAAAPAGRPLGAALEGIRVLDFSSFFATAYGSKFLSDLGADVIKVETPAADQMRPLPNPFEACQRGKRTIAVDLKSPEGRQIVRDLVATADVVMHNLRPGKAEKIGLGYDDLKAIKPDLVYCYLPGYGSRGPKAKLKSFAPLLSGFTGVLFENGGEGNGPAKGALGNEDYYNGLLGANAALMGLEHRGRTGEGQYVECPQLHSSLFVTSEHCLDADGNTHYAFRLDKDQTGFGPLYRIYRASDGWLCLAVVGDAAFSRLAGAMGLADLAADPRFATEKARQENAPALAEALEGWFAARGSLDAFRALDGAGVPCEIVREATWLDDFFWEDWAVQSDRVFVHGNSPWGRCREIGIVTRLSDTPARRRGPAPLLGGQSREILTELGYDAARIDGLVAGGQVIAAGEKAPERRAAQEAAE